MATILHLLRGQMSSPVNHLGGKCPHIPFFTGGQMSEGGNVRLPEHIALKIDTFQHSVVKNKKDTEVIFSLKRFRIIP